MTASWVATWGQDEAPADATAVFGPEDPVTVNTATASAPGPNGYRAATVHYLDASGREVNTAAPNGEIYSSSYDRFGNVVRTLEATNRALVLAQYPGAREQLSELGLLQYATPKRALRGLHPQPGAPGGAARAARHAGQRPPGHRIPL